MNSSVCCIECDHSDPIDSSSTRATIVRMIGFPQAPSLLRRRCPVLGFPQPTGHATNPFTFNMVFGMAF